MIIGVMVTETYEKIYHKKLKNLDIDELFKITKCILNRLLNLNIKCYEFCIEDSSDLRKLLKVLDKLNYSNICIQVHDVENSVKLAYRNPEVREKVLEELFSIIELASNHGIRIITIHPAYFKPSFTNYEPSRHIEKSLEYCEAFKTMTANLKKIASYAAKRKVLLALENMNYFHIEYGKKLVSAHFGRSSEELLQILRAVNSSALKVAFDVGHANLSYKRPEEFFRKVSKLVVNIHVNNNYGEHDDHNPLSLGTIDFTKVFTAIAEEGYKGSVIIERPCDKHIEEDVTVLRKIIAEANSSRS